MNRLAAGILAGIFVFPAAALAQSPSPSPAVSPSASPAAAVSAAPSAAVQATLPNGLRIVLLPNKLAPVATTIISYNVGSDDDTMPGIAHATEHMMFRGTSDVSAGQLADIAARAGAQYDAFTTNEYTAYYFKSPAAYVGLMLRLEADRMNGALDRAADWQSERGAIEQEIRANQSIPGWDIGVKMRRAFFGDAPFANDAGGTVESFEKMSASEIAAFYKAWYHPNNATVTVAGDIDPQQTLAQIRSVFGGIPAATLPAHKSIVLQPLASAAIEDTIELPVPATALGYRLPGSGSADEAAARVLIEALNNGRGPLEDLVAQGKVFIALAVSSSFPEVGIAEVMAVAPPGTDPKALQATLTAIIDTYRKNGVPDDLVQAAKIRLLASADYREASISGLGFSWSNALAEHRDSPDTIYDAISRVTDADVNRVLATYFDPSHQVTLLLHPKTTAAVPKVDPNAGVENVKYTPTVHEPLPAWALAYFKAPLRAPHDAGRVATMRLPNGITLTVLRETSSPTVVLTGTIRTSAQLYEPKGKDGVASLVEGLLPYGTTTYDRKAYQAQLDAIASNESLGPDFGVTVQAPNFDRGIALLADGLLHPAFPQQAFEVLRLQNQQAVAASEHLPQTQASIARRKALYPPGDPRRRRATASTVAAVTLDDVKRYYAFAYRPDLTTVAIVGDITPAQARATILKYFGAWHAAGKPPSFRFPQLKSTSEKAQSVTVKSPTNVQSQVTLTQTLDVRRNDDDYIPLELANTILSDEGTGSLLFEDLRKRKGYVYSVDSSMSIGRSESTFTISFASDPKNVDRAQAAAVADLRQLTQTPLPEVDVQRAKALLLAQRVLPLDSYGGVASNILDDAQYGLTTNDADAFWTQLLATTPTQIRDAMRRWIKPDHFVRVIVAPGR
ncbi:MAG: M16 family metallopeptidase [Vulcanimicrobiaceae bacterium]